MSLDPSPSQLSLLSLLIFHRSTGMQELEVIAFYSCDQELLRGRPGRGRETRRTLFRVRLELASSTPFRRLPLIRLDIYGQVPLEDLTLGNLLSLHQVNRSSLLRRVAASRVSHTFSFPSRLLFASCLPVEFEPTREVHYDTVLVLSTLRHFPTPHSSGSPMFARTSIAWSFA